VTIGPVIRKPIIPYDTGGTAGKLIEHTAGIRPRVQSMPRSAGADAHPYFVHRATWVEDVGFWVELVDAPALPAKPVRVPPRAEREPAGS
jgi:hypothetical protein